jgi:hypothetical protein
VTTLVAKRDCVVLCGTYISCLYKVAVIVYVCATWCLIPREGQLEGVRDRSVRLRRAIALMMEALSTSETLVNFYQTTRSSIPKGSHYRIRHRENLKSHVLIILTRYPEL